MDHVLNGLIIQQAASQALNYNMELVNKYVYYYL